MVVLRQLGIATSEATGWLDRLGDQALIVTGSLGALLIIYVLWWICGCRLRDIPCIRQFYRTTGIDRFDDFDVTCVIDEVLYPGKSTEKIKLFVKITAGRSSARTQQSTNGKFHESLDIRVLQGTEYVEVSLCDGRGHVLSAVTLDPVADILNMPKEDLQERELRLMKVSSRASPAVRDAKVKLSICLKHGFDVEGGLPVECRGGMSVVMQSHLAKVQKHGGGSLDEINLLAAACAGPVEHTRGWGQKRSAYLAAVGPPNSRHWIIGLWKSEDDFRAGRTGDLEFEVMDVVGIQGDPTDRHIFGIKYKKGTVKEELRFGHVDRARDVWVDALHLFTEKVRKRKGKHHHRSRSPKDDRRRGPLNAIPEGGGDSVYGQKHHHGREKQGSPEPPGGSDSRGRART